MSSKKVRAPQRSPLEDALLNEQIGAIRESQRLNELFAPIILREAGLTPTLDEQGKIVGLERTEESGAEAERARLRGSIETGLLKRQEAALGGKLPVSPTLEREIEQRQQQLSENLRRQLGPGFATSSPGIEALVRTGQSDIELREGDRRAGLNLATQLGLQREGANFSRLTGGANFPLSAGLNVAGAFQAPIGTLEQGLNRGFAASQQNVGQTNARIGSLISAGSQIAGTGAGLGFADLLGFGPK